MTFGTELSLDRAMSQKAPWQVNTTARRCMAAATFIASLMILGSASASAGCRDLERAQPGTVVFFRDAQCNGEKTVFDMNSEAGGYFAVVPNGWNDQVSSIQVGLGVKATIYDNGNFGGARATLWPGHYSGLWIYNDAVSSLRIEKIADDYVQAILYDNEEDEDANPNQMKAHLGEGTFNFNGNEEEILLRQQASRVWMPKGVKVTLYDDYNGKGEKFELDTANAAQSFTLATRGWGDRVKSIKVERLAVAVEPGKKPKTLTIVGRWVQVGGCRGDGCSETRMKYEIGVEQGREVSKESEIGASLSIMAGAEATGGVPGVGDITVTMEVTASVSATQRRAVMDSFLTKETLSSEQACSRGPVFQWQPEMRITAEDGSVSPIHSKSTLFACPGKDIEPNPANDINWLKQ